MLEGVVERGTGKGLNISSFKVAGKTGTAQIAKTGARKSGEQTAYGEAGNRIYQASFVGYFPTEKPLYTCIVIINSPSTGIYYGGLVAGPVFKEIAEKVYSSSLDFHKEINSGKNFLTHTPKLIKGKNNELSKIAQWLELPTEFTDSENKWVVPTESDSTKITLAPSEVEKLLKKGIIPNLSGLSAKDALYLLENSGLNVRLSGLGSVRGQSISAGTRFSKGNSITIILG